MEKRNNNEIKVCVTGASGYIGSLLVKKLLEKGYNVNATVRNLGENTKTRLLKSLPNAGTRLSLFQADINHPQDFGPAIQGCQHVFHVATPLPHTHNSKYKDITEAAKDGVRSIVGSCLRSQTVKRLIYTASVMSASPRREDGTGYESHIDEFCWTPLENLSSYTYMDNSNLDYIVSKTSSEREILSYGDETGNGKLEVVSLVCGLVGGETLLSYIPSSLSCVLSQITGDKFGINVLRLLQELLGSIPLVHVDDVCEAHIFCMEKPSLQGRFICAAESSTIQEMANLYQEILPNFLIPEVFMSGPIGGSKHDLSKLRKEGFEYKYGVKEILNDSVECSKRLGFL